MSGARVWFRVGGVLLLASLVAGCGEDVDPAPIIEVIDMEPSMLTVGQNDDLLLILHYVDSDGDIGGGLLDTFDCRFDSSEPPQTFPKVASDEVVDKGLEIDGTLNLHFFSIELVDHATPSVCAPFGISTLAPEELAYCFQVADSAGHRSNVTCSDVVTVVDPSG